MNKQAIVRYAHRDTPSLPNMQHRPFKSILKKCFKNEYHTPRRPKLQKCDTILCEHVEVARVPVAEIVPVPSLQSTLIVLLHSCTVSRKGETHTVNSSGVRNTGDSTFIHKIPFKPTFLLSMVDFFTITALRDQFESQLQYTINNLARLVSRSRHE